MAPFTKKQKAYAAILAVGGLALVMDRTFSGSPTTGPAEASASFAIPASERAAAPMMDAGGGPDALAAAAPGAPGAATATLARLSVTEQLHSAALAMNIEGPASVDVFRPSSDWLAEGLPAEKPVPAAAPGPSPAMEFAARRRLTGLMASGPQSLAIVDGQTLRIGQGIDGFCLVVVGNRSATFEGPARARVTLPMEDPSTLPAGRTPR
ncbi:MAG: hypothetical protein NTW19_20245 [Planctomycetota bacterium]|nr:hypothetical protein [Planctomycetota bacterium]